MSSSIPVINLITPASGPLTGGTQVTIFGQSFLNGCRVRFGGVDSPAVTFISSTQLVAVTPPGQALGPVNVRVVNSPGVAVAAQDAFTYVAAPPPPPPPVPVINSVSPASGSTSGGTQLIITGQNFAPGCVAKFGGVEAQTTFVSSTQLNAVTPAAQTVGFVTVRVLNPGQSQAGILQNAFQYVSAPPPTPTPPSPLITGVSPSTGSLAGGTQVTITGQNFQQGCLVRFGGIDAQTTFIDSTRLNVITPAGQTAGAVNVRVVNPGQQAGIAQNAFTYVSAPPPPAPTLPVITSINPASGTTNGGTQVTITGQNFAPNCQVKFEGNLAQVLSNSPTRLVVSTPAASAGAATVRVINPGQQPAVVPNGFTYFSAPPPPPPPAPIINAVSPSSGALAGATQVTLSGQNFKQGCQVRFGSNLAQILSSGANQLLVSTPAAQTAGFVNVRITNPDGQSSVLQNAFQYLTAPPPPPSTRVDVFAPGGGEVLRAGQSLTTRWNTTGTVAFHSVRLSLDGGATFTNVTTGDLPAVAREFTFTLPSPPTPSVSALVRVAARNASGAQVAQGDSRPFTLQQAAPAPAPLRVNLKFPNGGESFEEAQRIDITWESSSDVALAAHDVLLSLDGGTTFSTIASNLGGNARSFSWVAPAVESERARIRIVARATSGAQASDMSENNFAVNAGAPRIDSVTVNGMPASLARGTFITLTVKGRKLPAMPSGAVNDFVFKRMEGAQEVVEPAFVIRKVSGETKKERELRVEVLPSAKPGQYKLALGAAANTPSQAIAPPLVARGMVADDGSLVFPVGFDVAAVRYGKRRAGAGQMPVPHLSVLLVRGQSPDAESLVLTFVPGMRIAALEIPRRGSERFTDVQFADFLGNDQHFLVGICGRGQKSKSDIDPAFEVFDPVSGQALELADPTQPGNPTFRRTLIRACDATKPCMSTDPNGLRPNVDGAFVTRLDGKKEIMAIIPQVSFLTFDVQRIDAFVYFLHASPNGSAVRLSKTKVPNVDGNPIERNMVTFTDLKANASDTSKKMLVFSKSVLFTFDLTTRALLQTRVRQITDPINATIDNSRDVADFPRRNDCDPGEDKQSKKNQCSPQGRRYGQYRVLSFADAASPTGAPSRTRIVVAGHSVSGNIPGGGYAPGEPLVELGLTPLYTAYGNPLNEEASAGIPDRRFLQPIAAWAGATDVGAPLMGKYQNPFRNFYRYFPKSKKKRFLGLKRFLNGAILYRGTPPNGIDFIGDMEDSPSPARPVPSIVVSSALEDPKRVTPKDEDEEGVQTTFPKVMSAGFEIVRADNGRTREKLTMAGAIVFDVVKPSQTSTLGRILAWTGLTEGGSYDDGRLQVYAIERDGFGLRLVPKLKETDEPEEPALLDYSTLNRQPDGIAISGDSIALFNAVIEANGRRAILTFPKRNPANSFPRIANAYDVETLERRFTGVNLGGNLLAVAAPGELTLSPTSQGSSTLVLLDGNRMLFKSVVPSLTTWSLTSVSFNTNTPLRRQA
ncbi:MAG TPA: IPT/TIG domain-containing protein [Pyrinomonadaceae bacterium]|nr:IPT/TIG domain-containing protein [Pyrinomonadaceae bacterium]